MPSIKRDPLLGAARIVTSLMMVVCIFVAVMVAIGTGAVATVERGRVLAELAKIDAAPGSIWLILAAMVLIFILMVTAVVFFKRLLDIVGSVAAGNPFDQANADRLTQMGWLALGGQVLILPLMAIAEWFAPYLEKAGQGSEFGFDFDLGSILLILVLFILARVFRHGAAMREDLEGTV